MAKPGSFLLKAQTALIAGIKNEPYTFISMQPKLTPNMRIEGLVARRNWAVKYGTRQQKNQTSAELGEWFGIQEELGHCTWGPKPWNCEQHSSSHFPQHQMAISTGILVGRRQDDDDLVCLCEEWLARELYVWNLADHFQTGRVIVAGARTREGLRDGYGEPSCESPVRNQIWQLYLKQGPKIRARLVDAQDSAYILTMALSEGWEFPDPIKPKLSVPLEIRYDVNQKRVLTATDGVAGEIKRGWQETSYIAGEEPEFKWPDDGVNYPLLERMKD